MAVVKFGAKKLKMR